MSLLLLGLLGAAILGTVVFDVFGKDDSNDTDTDPTPVEEPGEALHFDGSGTLEGTEGDDTLAAGQDPDLAPETINLFGGDDTATIDVPFDITVNGGAGDDTLTSTNVGNTLNGGDGDDRLSGIDATSMYGGAGNDHITFDSDVELNDSVARIDGGAGDDRIEVFADAGVNTADRGGAFITGGSGSDEFNVVLDLQNSQDDAQILDTQIARIGDFDPNEDSLRIEIERNDATADRGVVVELEQTEVDGTYTSQITLTFAETAAATEAVATLTVLSDGPFGLADIQLVGV
ncbi:hypothetical protein EGN72_04350 [Pseudorhodobacter sp. E13]|uniref:calcium-binding protein n=1 Tax=Pseudorhodobacter sp. E13 TaxID=2487931 RepID=UPI000F8D7084|nr:hypothetical protein [Pseudorhodobacter sp. E13]RUS63471.1 hypothetical protein EGN72_04350 [Pseudorhodobacter sp. E13]